MKYAGSRIRKHFACRWPGIQTSNTPAASTTRRSKTASPGADYLSSARIAVASSDHIIRMLLRYQPKKRRFDTGHQLSSKFEANQILAAAARNPSRSRQQEAQKSGNVSVHGMSSTSILPRVKFDKAIVKRLFASWIELACTEHGISLIQ